MSSTAEIIGLDLGCSTSLLVAASGEILRNELGGHSSATLLGAGVSERFLGEAAVAPRSSHLRTTLTSLPLLLGKSHAEALELPQVRFAPWAETLEAGPEGSLRIRLGDEAQPVEALVAALLAKLGGLASAKLEAESLSFSLATPPSFGPAALRALKDATRVAGMEVQRFPQAADCLLACLHAKHPLAVDAAPRPVVILDMGASATAVVLAILRPGIAPETLLRSHGTVGCDDLDFRLWEHFRDWAAQQPRTASVEIEATSKRGFRLLRGVKKLRELLSTIATARVTVESLGEDLDVELEADRELLVRCCAAELAQIKALLDTAKAAVPEDAGEVGVEIVGGGTRAACVQALVREVFGAEVVLGQKLDDASAAFGAAVLARDQLAAAAAAEAAAAAAAAAEAAAAEAAAAETVAAEVADAAAVAATQESAATEEGTGEAPSETLSEAATDGAVPPPADAAAMDVTGEAFAEAAAEAAGEASGEANGEANGVNGDADEAEAAAEMERESAPAAEDPATAAEAAALEAAASAPGLSDADIEALRAAELAAQARDADARARQEATNALESFVLSMRGAKHREHGDMLDAAVLDPFLDDLENWPYTEEAEAATTEVWEAKLAAAKATVETELGRDWHAALEADRVATEARLQAAADRAAAERAAQPEGDDDHDQRRLKFSERLRLAERNKTEGTEIFKSGTNFKLAAARYHKGLTHCAKFEDLQLSPEQASEAAALKLSLNLNATQCYLKMEAWDKAETYATRSLELDETSIKARYRRAQARHKLRRIDDAMADVRAIPEEAQDKAIRKLKARLQAEIQRQKDKQRKMAQRMFA